MEALLSVHEAAQRLRISPWTVYCWLSKGRLAKIKIGSRSLISEAEIARVIEQGKKPCVKDGQRW
jgi:excisionase family DNA binding protein